MNCTDAPKLYGESAEHVRDDVVRSKLSRRVNLNDNRGAVMRMEEHSSVSVSQQVHQTSSRRGGGRVAIGSNNLRYKQPVQRAEEHIDSSRNDQNYRDDSHRDRGQEKVREGLQTAQSEYSGGNGYNNRTVSDNKNSNNDVNIKDVHNQKNQVDDRQSKRTNQIQSNSNNNQFNKNVIQKQSSSNQRNGETQTINRNVQENVPFGTRTTNRGTKKYNTSNLGNGDERKTQEKIQPHQKPQESGAVINRNHIRKLEQGDSDEAQITEETASFVKNSANRIPQNVKSVTDNPYPNHRSTYTPLQDPIYYTKQYDSNTATYSTKPFNNGLPFVANFQFTTTPQSTLAKDIFNVGSNVPATASNYQTETTSVPSAVSHRETTDYAVVYGTFNTGLQTTPKPSTFTQSVPVTTIAENRRITLNTAFTSTGNDNLSFGNQLPTTPSTNKISKVNFGAGFGNAQVGNEYYVSGGSTNAPLPLSYENGGRSYKKPPSGYTQTVFSSSAAPTLETTTADGFTSTPKFVASSPRPFRPKFYIESKKVTTTTKSPRKPVSTSSSVKSTNSGNFNKINFISNGQPNSHSPRLILGIIRQPTKPSNFSGKNVKTSTTPSYTATTSKSISAGGFFVTKSAAPLRTTPQTSFNSVAPSQEILPPLDPKPFQLPSTTAAPFTSSVRTPLTIPTYSISSARPFQAATQSEVVPTQPTPFSASKPQSVYENVDNMINALMAITGNGDRSSEAPRPGLVVPPSVGPQTLHTLAVYFANALDNIAADKNKSGSALDSKGHNNNAEEQFKSLLTKATVNRYNELFGDVEDTTVTDSPQEDNDLDTEHSNNPVQQTTPRVRQLARVFTEALSAYLDDPATFRKVLEEVRPTEPPTAVDETTTEEDEVLNFSDADIKPRPRPVLPTSPALLSPSPTWGYILALNKNNASDLRSNSIGREENLQSADTQSFVPRFNTLSADQKPQPTTPSPFVSSNLPVDHWTDSPDATKLWQSTLSVNPLALNKNFNGNDVTETPSAHESTVNTNRYLPETSTSLVNYELRSLPKLDLNSSQVHGILLDFMNNTEESNKLQRLLAKFNISQEEFIAKMKEIEGNPVTRRLILLLVSECADKGSEHTKRRSEGAEGLQVSDSSAVFSTQAAETTTVRNSVYGELVDESLKDGSEDARALQLLNSLYTIAAKWGK